MHDMYKVMVRALGLEPRTNALKGIFGKLHRVALSRNESQIANNHAGFVSSLRSKQLHWVAGINQILYHFCITLT